MKFIVLVYTNGRTVKDIVFTGQPVNQIDFHKERFKAKSYLSLYRDYPMCFLFEFSLLSISFNSVNIIHVGIIGKKINEFHKSWFGKL